MTAKVFLESLWGGSTLAQGFSLGSFKVRVYGSWLEGIALQSAQTPRKLASVASTGTGLKELASSRSSHTAKQFFAASATPSIGRFAGLHGTSSGSSSNLAPSLWGKTTIENALHITRHTRPLNQQATLTQKAITQQVTQGRRLALSAAEIRSMVGKAFSHQGSSRFFSGATRIAKELGGKASGETAAKTNETGYPGKRFIEWYLQKIEEKPLLVKSLTAGAIFVASDLCAQAIGGWEGGYDFPRSLRMAAFGTFMSGPLLHYWFGLMTRMYPGRDLISVCKKIFIGQTTVGPLFTAIFYSLNAALQGEDADAIWARLKRDLIPTLKAGLTYWPLIDLFTYSRVPVHLMPLTNNTASFLWTIYITFIAGQGGAE